MNGMYSKKLISKIAIFTLTVFSAAILSACSMNVNINDNADNKEERIVPSEERQQITKDFIGLMEADPELKDLMEESIHIASINNPDIKI